MIKSIYRCIFLTLILFVLLGGIYPLIVTSVGKIFFPLQSNGGVEYIGSQAVGANLIGQNFSSTKYFHGRPSFAGTLGYDGLSSTPSNLASTNPKLFTDINMHIIKILKGNPTVKRTDIPVELVTYSGSGLDPHISLQSALIQIPRVAKSRNIREDKVTKLVHSSLEKPIFGFFGVDIINVLFLNLKLDNEFNNN
ncbi:potassium-transporting ATPase subunit KdpC [Fluviispira multicolorata]|uniref:Potassium-transporting ATPase KdpC subunit n=1 Tax=Fluviispira multicolorata TaxID=2654512 RepID=A0A833JF30_9BACT|nr:potassium-transporting ATPase subunit KdpC [Fluviispira multicolorata]KAB8033511.1 potassium-transporting ATPase subunit KdpC [Fluviispira multicolorata]